MAKNKSRWPKQKNVFQVLNKQTKNKNKAKPVTSSLKHGGDEVELPQVSKVHSEMNHGEVLFRNTGSAAPGDVHFTNFGPVEERIKINAAKKERKVDSLNKVFTDVQREVKSVSKCTGHKPNKQVQVRKESPKEPVNVDGAAQLFSQL